MNIINEYKINNREKSECNFFFSSIHQKVKAKKLSLSINKLQQES